MGKYDQYLAGLPPQQESGGKYDAFTRDLPPVDEQGVLGAVGEALSARPELQPYGGIQDFTGTENPLVAAGQTLAAPIRAGMTMSQPGFRKAGEAVAESLGAEGVSPNISAGAGTILGMVPDIVQAGQALRGIYSSQNPLIKGLINTPKELGADYAAQNKAAGIVKAPVRSAANAVFEDPYQAPSALSKPKYAPVKSQQPQIVNAQGKVISPIPESSIQPGDVGPTSFTRPKPTILAEPLPTTVPKKLPREFANFYDFAKSRIDKFGEKLSPQELVNYKMHLEKQMTDGSIPKFKPQEEGGGITQIYQQASDLRSKIADIFKKSMDSKLSQSDLPKNIMSSRTSLDKANTISNKMHGIPRKILSGAKKTAKVGAIGGGLYGLYKALE